MSPHPADRDRMRWCGPLCLIVRDHLGSRPTEYPATVTGTGWDEPATVHDLDELRRAVAADVGIITEDADRWGKPDAPNDPEVVEQWAAWLVEHITEGLDRCGAVSLHITEPSSVEPWRQSSRHSTWRATSEAREVVA